MHRTAGYCAHCLPLGGASLFLAHSPSRTHVHTHTYTHTSPRHAHRHASADAITSHCALESTREIETNDSEVTCIAVSPDGAEMAVGLANGSVSLYDYTTGDFKNTVTRFAATEVTVSLCLRVACDDV